MWLQNQAVSLIFSTLLMAWHQITSLRPVAIWHWSQASCRSPQPGEAGVSRKPPRISLTVGCVVGAHGSFARWTRLWGRILWVTDAANIRISLLAYCRCTLCHTKPTKTCHFFWFALFFPVRQRAQWMHSEDLSTWSPLWQLLPYLLKPAQNQNECGIFQDRVLPDLFRPAQMLSVTVFQWEYQQMLLTRLSGQIMFLRFNCAAGFCVSNMVTLSSYHSF